MNTQLTITLAGEDHPQLINVLSAKTHALGGKWLISKINRLDNQVVGIIKIDIPADAVSDLKHAFLEQHALDIRVIDTPSQAEIMPTHPVTLKVEANDRPGLVHDLSRILDDIGIGIVNIENRRIGVPDLGKTLFFAEFQLNVSEEIDLEQLMEAMQQVDDGLLVKIVEPA